MLIVDVAGCELFDESTSEFITVRPCKLHLEHSLISLSKWESKWRKPYLDDRTPRTLPEFIDYVRCMTVNSGVDPNTYRALSRKNISEIQTYINDKQTATWFSKAQSKSGVTHGRIITSELIYYWMIAYNIPADYRKWHLSRLLTLIEVCNAENAPKNSMSRSEMANQRRALNAQRKASLKTTG